MRTRFSHVRDLLQSHRLARPLLEQGREASKLVSAVRDALPEPLQGHCVDAVVSETKLTIFFDSPAWQTRARFLSEQILGALSAYAIDEARFKVRATQADQCADDTKAQSVPRLSQKVVAHLYEAADHQSDPRLSEALRRLARHHGRGEGADEG